MRSLLICLTLVALSACASAPRERDLQAFSSGHVGCAPESVKVSEWTGGMGYSNWKAECAGKRFVCTGSMGGSGCKEVLK